MADFHFDQSHFNIISSLSFGIFYVFIFLRYMWFWFMLNDEPIMTNDYVVF